MSIIGEKQKLIVVSNRLPVSVSKVDGKLTFTQSSGGLATAMSSLDVPKDSFLWIGWPGINSDELTSADKRKISKKLAEHQCVPVYLTKDQVDNFYSGYANDTIWPLFHYFQSYVKHDEAYWQAYKKVNEIYKRTVAKHIGSDQSLVWIHDYHLMLLPKLLRENNSELAIGFFLHIPFPSYEIFRLLPNREEIFEGLLACDLVGVHMYDYVRHLLSSANRLMSADVDGFNIHHCNHNTVVDAFPIGIDYQKFESAANSPQVQERLKELRELYKDKKVILSVDRLDYSKGIPHRLEAFERFLEKNPKLHGKVTLSVVAVPSRTDVETYQKLRDQVDQTVSRINGKYSVPGWHPVAYQFKNLPFDELIALYALSDVALVTPLRDGMNLVAKEYIACKTDDTGVLILSEMAGAIDELHEALRINPNDTESIVKAIEVALKMPKTEQASRLKAMKKRISDYSVQVWAKDFVDQLQIIKKSQRKEHKKVLEVQDIKKLKSDYKKAIRRLFLLDYDGTLKSFTNSQRVDTSKPNQKTLKILKNLTKDPRNDVYIVSGRPKDHLETWFKGLDVGLVAEHGAFIRHKNSQWIEVKHNFSQHIQPLKRIIRKYNVRTPGANTETKASALVWHYRAVPSELAFVRREGMISELQEYIKNTDIELHLGNKIVELKPRNISKAHATKTILKHFKAYDFTVAIGDDYTDEDMFNAMPKDAHTIKVGLDDTSAVHRLKSVNDVLGLLKSIV